MRRLLRIVGTVRLVVLALAALGLVACEQAPTSGRPCARNSDCTDPLICKEGRCAVECYGQRDCLRGTHCVVLDAIGRCVIDVPRSTTSSPCGRDRPCSDESFVCRNYTCWNGCETSEECAPGSLCRAGVCANPDSQGSAYGVHVACDDDASCAEGEICASHAGSERACFRTCADDGECSDVAATRICAEIEDPTLDPHTTVCVIGCDPVRQDGCLESDRCEVALELEAGATPDYATFFECTRAQGTGLQGDPCGTLEPELDVCARGFGCAYAGADGSAEYECRRFCVTNEDCMDAGLACTGAPIDTIRNLDVIGAGTLHMCAPAS